MREREPSFNQENFVVLSNELIRSKSNLTLNEIKLLRLTIMQIMANDTELLTYKIPIIELGKLLQISNSNLYRDIDLITTHLLQEIVYIGDGNPKHKWKKFSWVSTCEYENGVVTIKLHEQLKPYLLGLKGYYTQYILEDILVLKSVYAIRIYELIKEEMKYQKVYANKTADIQLSVELIRIATNTEDKYTQMGHFKEKVVKSAIKEINEKLSYYITYTDIKKGRKIVGFNFHIESNQLKRLLEE